MVPAGTGKTEFALQLAAVTGRPAALISCDNGTDAATLVGMTVPDAAGGVTWQDGQLTRAIKTPGCVVCLDEPSVARPGALFVMQNVLANRQLFIAETGARVCVASGVVFVATDNTNGTGGGARKGYTDTNRLNAAFLDRFGVRVKVDYLPADREADVIVGYTGCTVELAQFAGHRGWRDARRGGRSDAFAWYRAAALAELGGTVDGWDRARGCVSKPRS